MGTQVTWFGTASGGHLGSQVAEQTGGTALTGPGPRPVTWSEPIPGLAGRRILKRHGRPGMVAGDAGPAGLRWS